MNPKDIADRAAVLMQYIDFSNPNAKSDAEISNLAVSLAIQLQLEAERQIHEINLAKKAEFDAQAAKDREVYEAQKKEIEAEKREKLAKKAQKATVSPELPAFVKDDFDFGPQEV